MLLALVVVVLEIVEEGNVVVQEVVFGGVCDCDVDCENYGLMMIG